MDALTVTLRAMHEAYAQLDLARARIRELETEIEALRGDGRADATAEG